MIFSDRRNVECDHFVHEIFWDPFASFSDRRLKGQLQGEGIFYPAAMNGDTHREVRTTRQTSDSKPSPLEQMDALLSEIEALTAKLARLETEVPAFLAQLEGACRPALSEAVLVRKRLISRLETMLPDGRRQKRLYRRGIEVVLELAGDLERRFGEDMSEVFRRWDVFDEDELSDGDAEEDEAFEQLADFWEETAAPRGKAADPEATAKGIYRALARELHPDKTTDEDERERRNGLMQDLTEAWRDRDLGTLLRLLHAHGSETAKAGSMDERSLNTCLAELRTTRKQLQDRFRARSYGELETGPVRWEELLENPAHQERLLRYYRRAAKEELREAQELELRWSTAARFHEDLAHR